MLSTTLNTSAAASFAKPWLALPFMIAVCCAMRLRYDCAMQTEDGQLMHLSALTYYPIKACAGTSVPRAQTNERGLVGDREFMIVDGDGNFLTQREHPRLALVKPTLGFGLLSITAPDMDTLTLDPLDARETRKVTVWEYSGTARDMGTQAAAWFSQYLGLSTRLVQQDHRQPRRVSPDYALHPHDQTSFSDGYPFLLISEASLADLNTRLGSPLPMNRFRPNLVVTDCAPFAEDTWRQIRIGDLTFAVVKPCARCAVTTTDQDTGKRGQEPLTALATFRRIQGNAKVMFGQNVIYAEPGAERGGWLEVGMSVDVLKVRSV
jgi:uncharacterized protein